MTRGHVIFPVLLVAIAALIFVASFHLPEGAMRRTSPALYPRIVALALGLSALWSLITEFRADEPSTSTDIVPTSNLPPAQVVPAPAPTHVLARYPLTTTIVASVLYPVAMQIIGYLLATILYTFVLGFMLQTKTRRGVVASVVVAVVLVAVTYATFSWGLGANLPRGRLG